MFKGHFCLPTACWLRFAMIGISARPAGSFLSGYRSITTSESSLDRNSSLDRPELALKRDVSRATKAGPIRRCQLGRRQRWKSRMPTQTLSSKQAWYAAPRGCFPSDRSDCDRNQTSREGL